MHGADAKRVSDIARLFAEVFEADSVDADDDFFDLGGDSLLATTLMAGIERQFGAVLPISTLLEASTPNALARVIFAASGDRTGDALVVVNETGSGPTLCCVHGMNGEAVFPRRLAESLGTERPIYGFRAIGLLAGERPLDSVEHIAENYLAALRRVRQSGPVVLLGHCGGSMIAYEMAQRLAAAGGPVVGLVLIDPAYTDLTAPFLFNSGLALLQKQAAARGAVSGILGKFDAGADLSDGRRRSLLKVALHAAVAAYAPKPYGGPTLLLHTTARKHALLHPVLGFPAVLSDFATVEIPSRHMNMFERHMPEVVNAVAGFLDRISGSSATARQRVVAPAAPAGR